MKIIIWLIWERPLKITSRIGDSKEYRDRTKKTLGTVIELERCHWNKEVDLHTKMVSKDKEAPILHLRSTLPAEKSKASMAESNPPVISSQGLCLLKFTQLAMFLCTPCKCLTRDLADMSITVTLPESSAADSKAPFPLIAKWLISSLLKLNSFTAWHWAPPWQLSYTVTILNSILLASILGWWHYFLVTYSSQVHKASSWGKIMQLSAGETLIVNEKKFTKPWIRQLALNKWLAWRIIVLTARIMSSQDVGWRYLVTHRALTANFDLTIRQQAPMSSTSRKRQHCICQISSKSDEWLSSFNPQGTIIHSIVFSKLLICQQSMVKTSDNILLVATLEMCTLRRSNPKIWLLWQQYSWDSMAGFSTSEGTAVSFAAIWSRFARSLALKSVTETAPSCMRGTRHSRDIRNSRVHTWREFDCLWKTQSLLKNSPCLNTAIKHGSPNISLNSMCWWHIPSAQYWTHGTILSSHSIPYQISVPRCLTAKAESWNSYNAVHSTFCLLCNFNHLTSFCSLWTAVSTTKHLVCSQRVFSFPRYQYSDMAHKAVPIVFAFDH